MQEPEEMRTRRLVLRALRRSDVDAFVALSTAAETHPFDPHVRKTPDQALVAFDRFMTSWEPDGIGYWLVRLHGAEGVIGFGGLRPWVEDGEPVLNLAYRFWPQAWGQGYAREMAQAALDWARRHRPDKPVLIVTDEDNGPAVRLAERLGFDRHVERVSGGRPEVVYRLPAAVDAGNRVRHRG